MRAIATGSWYTLKLAFTIFAVIAMALPLSHFNSTMRGLGGGLWDQMLQGLSQAEDLVALPIAGLFRISPDSELFLWVKAMIPIDLAVLLWILPDPASRGADDSAFPPER
jgi:hypothetical protein